MEGYGKWWVINEMLRESSRYKIEDDENNWGALADDMKCTIQDVKDFIAECHRPFKLIEWDEIDGKKFFYSPALLVRMIHLDNVRQKRVQAGVASGESRGKTEW